MISASMAGSRGQIHRIEQGGQLLEGSGIRGMYRPNHPGHSRHQTLLLWRVASPFVVPRSRGEGVTLKGIEGAQRQELGERIQSFLRLSQQQRIGQIPGVSSSR